MVFKRASFIVASFTDEPTLQLEPILPTWQCDTASHFITVTLPTDVWVNFKNISHNLCAVRYALESA